VVIWRLGHDPEIGLHAEYEDATPTIVTYAREKWQRREDKELADAHAKYDNDEALSGFFDENSTEWYLIDHGAVGPSPHQISEIET
jgi:hypothetical protein